MTLGRRSPRIQLLEFPQISAGDFRVRIQDLLASRAILDWPELRAQMTDVQRRVFDDARIRQADVERWTDALIEQNRQSVEEAINKQLQQVGCGSRPAALGEKIRDTIRDAALKSAESIANTFNRDLANAVLSIGGSTPRANYRTYRTRLFGDTPNSIYPGFANWATRRGLWKGIQISVNETSMAINRGTELFFRRNPELQARGEVKPLTYHCEVCERGVKGNPYDTVEAAYAAGPWPAHVNCAHYVEAKPRQLAPDCSEVWRGED